MGYLKQQHIDCYKGTCLVNDYDRCYIQPDNVSYYVDADTVPDAPVSTDGQDYDPKMDVDQG